MAIPFVPRHKVKISKGALDFVELDCTINEAHDFDTVVTEHAIEAGASVADHVRITPAKLSMSGIVSNTPLSLIPNINPLRAEDALEKLLGYQEEAELLEVDTKLRVYDNMLLKKVRVTRDVDTGNVVALDLEFQELLTVASLFAVVAAPSTDVKAAQKKQSLGKKPTRTKRVGVLRGLVKSATGV
jgi:hypothetical protein